MYFNHLDHFFKVVKIYSSSGYAVFGVFYVMEDSCHRVWFFFLSFFFCLALMTQTVYTNQALTLWALTGEVNDTNSFFQASRGSVMLCAMFCWETLGSAIQVTVTLTCT